MKAVVDLFEELERISREHEELTDTDVRESMHFVLNYYSAWGSRELSSRALSKSSLENKEMLS